MPTLPVIKIAYPGKEAQGGQRSLSLPRLRLPVQPAGLGGRAAPQHGYGIRLRRKSLTGQPKDEAGQAQGAAGPQLIQSGNHPFIQSDNYQIIHSDGHQDILIGNHPFILSGNHPFILSLSKDARAARPPLPSPVAFAREVLGVELWAKQVEVLNALTEHRRVAVKAGNGLGKGFCAAVALLWFVHSHPGGAIALSTAPTFRQVRHVLWRQIRRLYRPVAKTLGGEMLHTRWDLDDNRYALGLSADGADQFQGFHSPNVFIVVDEAEGVSEEIYEAIESVMTSADPLLLLIGNPTSMSGAFRRAFHEERGIYRAITISALESPNVQAGRVVIPGLTTLQWVEEHRQIWEETSDIYRARVLGEFPDQGEDTLIRLSHIEAAVKGPVIDAVSWTIDSETVIGSERAAAEDVIIAVDVARYGSDSSVILRRRGDCVEDIQTLAQMDTMQLVGRVAAAIRQHNPAYVLIDEIGIGAGVVDRLRQLGHPVHGVNVARKPINPRKFLNLRAEGYWRLRERFGSGDISIPDDRRLIAELSSLRYFYTEGDRLKIESKDEIRKRNLPSPDRADALMLAFLPPPARLRLWT